MTAFAVVAEGIERAEHATMLRQMECGTGQGYFFAKPMAPEDMVAWMKTQRPVPRVPEQRKSGEVLGEVSLDSVG